MHLLYRPIQPADLEACWRIVQGDRFYPPALKPSRTKFWQSLLAENSAPSVLVEDADRPACDRTRAFSFSVFVTDEFAAAAKTSLPPRTDAHLHAQAAAGSVSSVSGTAAIGHANARDGLILYAGPLVYASAPTESEHVAAAELMFSALFTEHAGYQIKELLLESSLPTKWVASNAAGLACRTEYAGYFRSRPNLLPPEARPCLYGLTRPEALDTLGSRFLPLFLSARPRLGFRSGEQRLLSRKSAARRKRTVFCPTCAVTRKNSAALSPLRSLGGFLRGRRSSRRNWMCRAEVKMNPFVCQQGAGQGHDAQQQQLPRKPGQGDADSGGGRRGRSRCLQRLQARNRRMEEVQGGDKNKDKHPNAEQKDQQSDQSAGQIGMGMRGMRARDGHRDGSC